MPELLAKVAASAVKAIPGADGAGVILLRVDQLDNRVQALAASAPFVKEIDRLQYEVLHEGPCITAALERRTVRSGSLGGEKLWPRFGPRVDQLGVHSVLSIPLLYQALTVSLQTALRRSPDHRSGHRDPPQPRWCHRTRSLRPAPPHQPSRPRHPR